MDQERAENISRAQKQAGSFLTQILFLIIPLLIGLLLAFLWYGDLGLITLQNHPIKNKHRVVIGCYFGWFDLVFR